MSSSVLLLLKTAAQVQFNFGGERYRKRSVFEFNSWVTGYITQEVGNNKLYRILVGETAWKTEDMCDNIKADDRKIDHMDGTCEIMEFGIFCDKIPHSAIYQRVGYFTNHRCCTEYLKF
jgi:hypothetical protein